MRTIRAKWPGNAHYYFLKGRIRADLGRAQEGIQIIQKGIKKHPENAQLHFQLGRLYQQVNEVVLAKQHFLKALDNNFPNQNLIKRILEN